MPPGAFLKKDNFSAKINFKREIDGSVKIYKIVFT